ncbi:hypothetical protein CcCBS67573_g00105 [Chytriomyces confervae]|uniref:Mitochondrial carrier protein n=1 Tax=Chytriomyces confervae TaxID=246404 RepID=A0A507FT99_9FUNG|nr:hypothetical protein CcCBS67573_g00105 [Chytriomyces confervae]
MMEEDLIVESLHTAHEGTGEKYFWIDFVAGTFGGAAGVIVGHPLDTVKVRLQAQAMSAASQRKYSGTLNCVATILREEKLKGLYKGMASPVVGVAAINSLLFGVHGWFMHHIAGDNTPTVSNIFWAGCGSGLVNAFLACPMELVKIRLQNQTSSNGGSSMTSYSGPIDCCRKIYKTGGIRAFYKGLHVTIWRETPSYGAYFASYEIFTHLFTPPGQSLDVPSPGLLLAGGLAGIVGWLSTYPFDVIKTHIQSDLSGKNQSMLQAAGSIYRKEGIRPFFSGLGATAIRAFPTNAATFYAVCWMRNLLDPKPVSQQRTRE